MQSTVSQLVQVLGQDRFDLLLSEVKIVMGTGYDSPNLYKAVNSSHRINGRKVPAFCGAPAEEDPRERTLYYYGEQALENLLTSDVISEEEMRGCCSIVKGYKLPAPEPRYSEPSEPLQGRVVRVLFK